MDELRGGNYKCVEEIVSHKVKGKGCIGKTQIPIDRKIEIDGEANTERVSEFRSTAVEKNPYAQAFKVRTGCPTAHNIEPCLNTCILKTPTGRRSSSN